MPDILIRGMEMPKGCGECPFAQYRVENLYNYCTILKRLFAEAAKRLDKCPLVEWNKRAEPKAHYPVWVEGDFDNG